MDGRVDVARAHRVLGERIAALPTIGEVMARRLVSFRDLNGGIDSLDSLEQIRGMGPKTLKKIEPYIADFSHP